MTLLWKETGRLGTRKGEKISGVMVETRSQKAPEDEKAMLDVEIHPNRALDENRAGPGTERNGKRMLTSEPYVNK